MLRIERVIEALSDFENEGITAAALAETLGLTRANVSSDLNRLCADGHACKGEGRPVRYFPIAACHSTKNQTGDFDAFLRENPSLFHCGEQAKAAVLYPPNGMHMLLLGPTGSGKSMFAEKIYQYALEQGSLVSNGSFITFNCADYANNAQLLLSQLFGVVKGAYTGATADKAGLLEAADGGILFLDEIHRLPPEGQEMLFSYIDRQNFRRLGETGGERSARVLLICATTEAPESALLTTFIRRIPMILQIPALAERSLEERLHLVNVFFQAEAQQLGETLQVSVNSMRALLGYSCPANIGQLRTDIQILCARAYSEYLSGKRESLSITSFGLPAHIRTTFFQHEKIRRDIWEMFSGVTKRFIVFEPSGTKTILASDTVEYEDIYQLIEQRMTDMRRVGVSETEIHEEMGQLLRRYYENFHTKAKTLSDYSSLERYVGPEVSATVDKMLALAANQLRRTIGDPLRYGLTLHVYNALSRVRQGQTIVNPRLESIQQNSPELYQVALECLDIAAEDFGLIFPEDEAGFIALFFSSTQQTIDEQATVEVILVMHGERTASSMAETANRLTGSNIVRGFDMKLDENPQTIYERILAYQRTRVNVREVLLLVDMGSLSDFAYSLERDLGVRCKHFVLASTLHAMEAARKASLGYSLHDVYAATKKVNELSELSGIDGIDEADKKIYLLSVCTTGDGSAKVISDRLTKRLDLKDSLCEIIPLQLTDRANFIQRVESLEETGRIIGVVSAFDTGLNIQHFSLVQVFDATGLARIQDLIDREASFVEVAHALVPMLESVNGAVVAGDIRSTIERIADGLGRELTGEMLIGCFCHIGCMIDRLKRGETTSKFPNTRELAEKYPGERALIETQCKRLGKEYHIVVPEDEICYLTAFFTREDLVF